MNDSKNIYFNLINNSITYMFKVNFFCYKYILLIHKCHYFQGVALYDILQPELTLLCHKKVTNCVILNL